MDTHKTKLFLYNDAFVVRYYQTDIVRVRQVSDNQQEITLDTAGYLTRTTFQRIMAAAEAFGLSYVLVKENAKKWMVTGEGQLFGAIDKDTSSLTFTMHNGNSVRDEAFRDRVLKMGAIDKR